MNYEVSWWCAQHEGGTKFYELVRVHNVSTGRSIAIRRWGKDTVRRTPAGGELKLERGCDAIDFRKLQDQKRGRNYTINVIGPAYGFAERLAEMRDAKMGESELKIRLNGNYGADIAHRVVTYLEHGEFERSTSVAATIGEAIEAPKSRPAPTAKSVTRDETWGSW